MIDVPLLLAFIAAAAVLAVTPGVDTAMVLNTAVSTGKRPALMAGLGIALGCLLWGVVVSFGLGAVLQTSEAAYKAVKYLGAIYLLWIGIGLLMRPRSTSESGLRAKLKDKGGQAFRRGFMVNVLNPKVGIFYLTFLPQFVPQSADVASYSLLLASIHVLLSLAWFCVLIIATLPLGEFLKNPRSVKMLDRVTGGIFVFFAVRLASQT